MQERGLKEQLVTLKIHLMQSLLMQERGLKAICPPTKVALGGSLLMQERGLKGENLGDGYLHHRRSSRRSVELRKPEKSVAPRTGAWIERHQDIPELRLRPSLLT